MSNIPGCPPDKSKIAKYMRNKNAFNMMPFIGGPIGSAVMKPPSFEAQDALKRQNATLQVKTDELFQLLESRQEEIATLLSDSITTLETYTDTMDLLSGEPLREGITLNSVSIGALLIVLLIVIFFGI